MLNQPDIPRLVQTSDQGSLEPLQRLYIAIGVLLLLLGLGTGGYMELEGWSFSDALFMSVITLSTVGYQTVHHLDVRGEYFTIILIVTGVGTVGYAIATLSELVLEGHVYKLLGGRRMDRKIAALKDHIIVCGYGKIGSLVSEGLHVRNIPFLVIEENPVNVQEAIAKGYLVLSGNAADEEVLRQAGVIRARSLLVTLTSRPAESVYVTMSSRLENPDMTIIAMATDPKAESKLLRAGATKVVSPFALGSHRMILALTRPTLLDVIDIIAGKGDTGLALEEIPVPQNSPFIGMTVERFSRSLMIKSHVVAILKSGESALMLPSAETILSAGDQMVMIGERLELDRIAMELSGMAAI
ncbi:potassium channel family protein [Leptospirillum ferrooxidans]|jgi:voltage-gated potassium channel|uniref:Putative potassium channel protein n=1 Tax=Leptospirillum ferrooxidans (strain C2-3) TaxID=1162668 RepID=I0IR91_LEPFC|nr:potassium channel protein [Leptospirillum ferrooxidans]BAM07790.1 putative potassium channel protein [Leptospirillum ferrooxidans C2-3]